MFVMIFPDGYQMRMTSHDAQDTLDGYRGTDLTAKTVNDVNTVVALPSHIVAGQTFTLIGSVYGPLADAIADHNHRNETDRLAAAV